MLDRRSSRLGKFVGARVAATWRKVSSTCPIRAIVQCACHAASARSSNTKNGKEPSSSAHAHMVGRKLACTWEYTPYSVRSHVAVWGSVAPFTNTDVPSPHVTIRRDAVVYPRVTGR